jgi:hypothetical protein
MKKGILFVVILPVLVFALAGVSYAWQGRMGGMEDPYGLVADESDFLIHPAKIANGEGVRFYGDYRFTFTGVTDWDLRTSSFTPGGVFVSSSSTDVSGEEAGHNGLVGASFPLGPGRMGIFFTYAGMRGGYDGDAAGFLVPVRLEMKNDVDDFALRLLYGLPIGGFKLGAEAQIAYRQELQELTTFSSDNILGNRVFHPYPFPNNSRYWEALFKGSMEGKVGPLDLEFTLRGGFDFAGTSKRHVEDQIPPGSPFDGFDAKGDVDGWQIGEDLWLRYPLADGLTLPFLVRVDYLQKTWQGHGPGSGTLAGFDVGYRGEETNLAIAVGGGVDKEFGKATRIAAGIYYNYLQGKESFDQNFIGPTSFELQGDTFPDSVEHQVLLRLAGEHTLSPTVALRAGLNFFYGWVTPKIKISDITSGSPADIFEGSGSGSHWGIGVSLGGTIKVKPLTLEPFIGGGYQQLHQKLNADDFGGSTLLTLTDEKISRNEWLVTTGLSILFDL